MQCQFSICLVEDNTLLAYKCKCEDINDILCNYPSLKSVYISHCDFCSSTISYNFIDLISEQNLLLNCYILNINMETNIMKYICSKLIRKERDTETENYTLILHCISHSFTSITTLVNYLYTDSEYDYYQNDSVILLTNDTILGYHMTNELFLLLLQLPLSFTVWKLWYCKAEFNILDLINNVEPGITNCLTELDLSHCNIIDKNKCHFLKNTQNFTCLTKFNVHGFKTLCHFIEETALFLLHNTQLEELDISNLDLNVENCRVLTQSLTRHSKLTKLNISNIGNVSDEDVAVILSHNVKIEELELNNLMTKDFSTITNSMKCLVHLKNLDISNNKITADNIQDILSHNTKLVHLNLSNLSLCLKDFMIIAPKMKNISNLKSLDISRNNAHNYALDDSSESTKTDSIAALFSHNSKLEDLNLSNLNLNEKDFIYVATILNKMSQLRKLNISNHGIDDDSATVAIVTLLNHIVDLEMLDMSDIRLREINVIKVAKALQKRSKLTKLSIRCYDDVTTDVVDAITAIFPHNSSLTDIELNGGIIEASRFIWCDNINIKKADTATAFLSNCTKLEVFDMSSVKMEAADAIRVFKSMKNTSTLKTFDISCCDYGDAAANSIAEVLANNKQLKKIKLSYSDIRPVGGIKIFSGMKNLHNLIKLDVSLNYIADKEAYEDSESLAAMFVPIVSRISHLTTKPVTHTAVQYLASVVEHNPMLQQLNIKDIDLHSEPTIIVIFKSMKNLTKLTELSISYSSITNNAAKLLACILSHNISLQKLYLCSCSLQTEGAIEIFNAIRNHVCLTYLDIRDNDDIGDQAVDGLRTILSNNPKLVYHAPPRITKLANIQKT